MKEVCLNLSECPALGDLICATPTIRKLSEAYEQKIIVVSPIPELFKNLPYVKASYKSSSIDWEYFNQHFIMHNSFYNVGKKSERGVEMKHNTMDIRQFHAVHLGFMLNKNELHCDYVPLTENRFDLPKHYVAIHPVKTWSNRTWAAAKWMELVKKLNEDGVYVVSIGKDSSEDGFFSVNKPVFNFYIPHGMNLMNQTSISDCYHIIKNATCFVTMDSGLLHLAGTTDTHIIQLGSSINPDLRAPYRHNEQEHKYSYVDGTCKLQCCSNMKYAKEYWPTIDYVQPLVGCLEKLETFECHPEVKQVYEEVINCLATF